MNQLMNNGMIQEIENILLNARNHVSVEVNFVKNVHGNWKNYCGRCCFT